MDSTGAAKEVGKQPDSPWPRPGEWVLLFIVATMAVVAMVAGCCADGAPEHRHAWSETGRTCWCATWTCTVRERCACGETREREAEHGGPCPME